VLSETALLDWLEERGNKELSVPYWSGCSVKPAGSPAHQSSSQATFSPLLVGVLSETTPPCLGPIGWVLILSVPYWSGYSVKQYFTAFVMREHTTFSPLLVGVLSETSPSSVITALYDTFSPLLVGVLSETFEDWAEAQEQGFAFSPLLVGVLSETSLFRGQ